MTITVKQQNWALGRLVAHRGYAAKHPENTLPAVEAAIQSGARYVEVDVQLSRDAEPVLFHDRELQRLCAMPGAVHEYDWPALQAMSVWDPQLTGPKQPVAMAHLGGLVSLLQAWPDVTLFVELKRISLQQAGIKSMLDKVLPQLDPIAARTVIISYSLEALQYVRQTSAFPIGVVMDDWGQRLASEVTALQPEYFFCDIDSLPPEGKLTFPPSRVVVYECVDPRLARKVLIRGVHMVETFAIGEMIAALHLEHE